MTHQTKKKRVDDQAIPVDAAQRPLQLQRRRVWRACESCRRKKIKCDGNEPTCSQCSASGSQCTWLQTKDRAALSRHYVQELEARLLHMESLFSQIAPAVLGQLGPTPDGISAQPPMPSSSDATTSAASIIQSLVDKDKQAYRNTADNHSTPDSSSSVKVEDDVSDSLGQLTLDEHGHMRWIGGSSTMSLIQSFKAATAAPHHRVSPMSEDTSAPGRLYFPASVFFGKVRALPGPEEVEYPARDLADKLVEAYFSRFHFLIPVIDKPSFMFKYSYLMEHTNDQHLARTETAFIALVFAVFACAAQLIEDPRLKGEKEDDGGMGMVYYERRVPQPFTSALILHYISHASIQVAHVQCFILMSSFLCSVNCLPQAWLLIGQAVRAAQDLGLHRSPRRHQLTSIEQETRRKIWWGVYSLDRMLALALGRPIGAEDIDCDVELPVDIDDELLPEYFKGAPMATEGPSLMTGFISLTSLYGIAGRVMRQVYGVDKQDSLEPERRAQLQRDVEALDKELTQWLDDLPAVFKSNMTNERQVSMGAVLCSHYYSVLTALHRNLLPVKRDHPVAPRSTAKAVSSARACIRLAPFIKNVVPPSHHLAFFIQHLFSSAVIILLYAMHVTDLNAANAALEEVQSCLTALESWEGHWPGARKFKELLSDLMATAREAVQSNQNGTSTLPSLPTPTNTLPTPTVPFDPKGRRNSFTSPSTAGRAIRNKPNTLRRNLSPDAPRPSRTSTSIRYDRTHRFLSPLPHRFIHIVFFLAHRARSTSRKRGYDESDELGQAGPSNPYRLQFQLGFGRPNLSPHSSPTSAKSYPSPPMAAAEPPSQDRSPQIMAAPSFGSLNGPVSPVNASSPSRYDFDFGVTQNPFGQASNETWTYDGDRGGLDVYTGGPQSLLPAGTYDPQPTVDPSFLSYGGTSVSQPSNTYFGAPSSSTYPAAGLPFHGLDYLRNFDPEGLHLQGEQDSLGQGFDVGAFRYDPEIPFSLGDLSSESRTDGR
ncbi:hypothetical protein BV25DRAFT_1792806 [Artomyces pyxidatus]|uniref:Uncharacterized protein n=1 Tax=Artomyces pyxidatus TaxID=48021 RepID=A0ACB8TKT4_9AGAM|nr:hypothetical protein BV25DRAFT_1792806 [Artomyces pyxidatus]